jgi:hypothetical protein
MIRLVCCAFIFLFTQQVKTRGEPSLCVKMDCCVHFYLFIHTTLIKKKLYFLSVENGGLALLLVCTTKCVFLSYLFCFYSAKKMCEGLRARGRESLGIVVPFLFFCSFQEEGVGQRFSNYLVLLPCRTPFYFVLHSDFSAFFPSSPQITQCFTSS